VSHLSADNLILLALFTPMVFGGGIVLLVGSFLSQES
jgi:hypothetical protein